MVGVLVDLATLAQKPATNQATPAPPESLATTPEPMVGVLVDRATLAQKPATNQATPAPPESLAATLEPMVGVLVDLATLAPNPAMNQATLAPRESIVTTLEPEVGVLADLATLAPNPATNLALPAPRESIATTLEPMFGEERSRVISRKARRRQDQRSCLTNEDGLVVLSKSTLLTKLRNEWRYLLDPAQLLNLCFFFECPISHHKYTEANTNDSPDLLGPFSRSRWKYMTKIHVLFPSDVGHMYIAERGNLPHYQEVFSKVVLALERYDNQMPVYLYMRGEDYSNHFMLVGNSAKTVQPFVDRMD
jgi:hypothetical protein